MVNESRWYVGTMNDGYFVIDKPPQPAPQLTNVCTMNHEVNVIVACDSNKEAAELLVAEHNARIAVLRESERAFAAGHSAGMLAESDKAESHDCEEGTCVCSEEG